MDSKNFFYQRLDVGLKDFPSQAQVTIPFLATRLILSNDTDAELGFSFQGPNLHGELFCDDDPIVFDGISVGKVWFKSVSNSKVRVWAWRL